MRKLLRTLLRWLTKPFRRRPPLVRVLHSLPIGNAQQDPVEVARRHVLVATVTAALNAARDIDLLRRQLAAENSTLQQALDDIHISFLRGLERQVRGKDGN